MLGKAPEDVTQLADVVIIHHKRNNFKLSAYFFADFFKFSFNCSEAERFLNIIFCIIALEGDKSGLDRRTK